MPENEFEKQVQQKMEELKFTPSAEVWQKVELQIIPQKRDRRWLLFLLLFIFFILGGIFWWNNGKQKGSIVNNDLSESINTTTSNTNTSKNYYHEKKLAIQKEKIIQDVPPALIQTEKKEQDDIQVSQRKNASTQTERGNKSRGERPELKNKGKATVIIRAADAESISNENPIENELKPGNPEPIIERPPDIIQYEAATEKSEIPDSNVIVKTEKANAIEKDKGLSANIGKKEKAKTKWNFGVVLDIGLSATQTSYLGLNNDQYSSPAADYNTGTGPDNTPTTPDNINTLTPATAKKGIGFTAGVFAAKNISKKSLIIAGISYKLFSTSIQTGEKATTGATASTSSDIYNIGNTQTYHNYYHFIEVPLEIQSQIGKGKKVPFYWNAGVVLSQLVNSNTLQFDNATGKYYVNNELVNKTGIGVSAGVIFDIAKNKKTLFQVGPIIYYSLTDIAKEGLYDKAHYSFIGLRFRKQLTKK